MSEIKRVSLTMQVSGSGGSNNNASNNNDVTNKKSNFGGLLQNHQNDTAAAVATITPTSTLPTNTAFPSSPFNQNLSNSGNSNDNNGEPIAKKKMKTYRLALELFQPNVDSFAEFNYSKLIYAEKKKQKKMKEKPNGFSDPFEENDDDVVRIAKEMELKYGVNSENNRKKNRDEFCDKGLGYDESDSFIDNTEAYDEVIPDEVDTVEGGFYINSGLLEFRQLSKYEKETEEIVKMVKSKKRVIISSSEDSEESNDDEENEIDTDKKSSKKSEHHHIDLIPNGHIEKKHKSSGGQESSSSSSSKSKSKHKDKKVKKNKEMQRTDENVATSSIMSENNVNPLDLVKEKSIKTTTVKDMLKAKRDNFLKMQNENGGKSSNDSTDTSQDDSDSDTDEPSHKLQKISHDGTIEEKYRTSEIKLPENLSMELLKHINDLKDLSKVKNRIGKNFHFDEQNSDLFLLIDDNSQCLDKLLRNQIFAHLEYHLSLPKYYLLRKGKQLRIKQEKYKLKKSYLKLKKAVAEIMPSIIMTYETTFEKVFQIRSQIPPKELEKSGKPSKYPKFPKKKFPWNDPMRNLLYDLYQTRWTSFTVLRTRKESFEDFVNSYLKDQVVSIWPTGWMSFDELKKELQTRKNSIKKSKEIKKSDTNTLTTTTTSSEFTTSNSGKITGTDVLTSISDNSKSSNTASHLSKSVFNAQSLAANNNLVVTISPNNNNCGNHNLDIGKQASISITTVSDSSKSNNFNKKMDDNQKQTHSLKQSKHNDSKHNIKLEKIPSNITLVSSTTSSTSIDLTSPSKRTDHSINNIISCSPTSSLLSSHQSVIPTIMSDPLPISPPSTNATHIITVDNYKNSSDIINSSKTILFNNNSSNSNANNSNNNNNNKVSQKENSIRMNSMINRRMTVESTSSNDSSDDVEIVSCFPNPSSVPTSVVQNKYAKNKISMKSDKICNSSTSNSNQKHLNIASNKNECVDRESDSDSDNKDKLTFLQTMNSLKQLEQMQKTNQIDPEKMSLTFDKDMLK